MVVQDTTHIPNIPIVSVKDFGAVGNGFVDDYRAIQNACNFCIAYPASCTAVRFPVGHYFISRPIILQDTAYGKWQFFTIRLVGDAPAKSASDAYLSSIICGFTDGFGIGIQRGRGIQIENLNIQGKYTFPSTINNYNIGTTLYSEWNTGQVRDTRFAPYSGICIDPFCDSTQIGATDGYTGLRSYYLPGTGRGGTSGVEIEQCAVHGFAVGVMLTPNPLTQNDEMINLIDDCVDGVKVAIAIGQAQSKEIHIDRFRCWASTYTILDGLNYGVGGGGGSVMINGMNIAGNVNQLFNLATSTFTLSAKDVYSESLFRIGFVGAGAGSNFINFDINFLTGPGMPAADYIILGQANFHGGQLRYYDNDRTHRLNFITGANMRNSLMFRDMVINNPPLVTALYGIPTNSYPSAVFDNVRGYYTPLKKDFDTLMTFPYRMSYFNIDRINWVGTLVESGIGAVAKIGDYIIGEPTAQTRNYYDVPYDCPTKQIGRVTAIKGDSLFLDEIGLNTFSNTQFDGIYIDRMK